MRRRNKDFDRRTAAIGSFERLCFRSFATRPSVFLFQLERNPAMLGARMIFREQGRPMLKWIADHPIVVVLVLIGGVGGGVASLSNGAQTIFNWLQPVRVRFVELSGEICTVPHTVQCVESNMAFLRQLEAIDDQRVRLDVTIEDGGADARFGGCDDDFVSLHEAILGSSAQGIFEVAGEWSDCEVGQLIRFPTDVAQQSQTGTGSEITVYRIIGEFVLGQTDVGISPTAIDPGATSFTPIVVSD